MNRSWLAALALAAALWSLSDRAGAQSIAGVAVADDPGMEDRLGLDLKLEVPEFRIDGRTRVGWFTTSHFYLDIDLHALKWPRSWILMPASLGLEASVGRTSVFLEAGVGVSLSGLETFSPLLPPGKLFPALTLGFMYGKRG